MKIDIVITGVMEFPDYMEEIVLKSIKDNFVLDMPTMVVPPLILRYTSVQRVDNG